MFDLLLLALLIGSENQASALLAEIRRAARLNVEMLGPKLAAVEQVKGEPVGDDRSQLLHEIQREGGTARSKAVQIADLRIQSNSFEGGATLRTEQGIEERKKGVGGVSGRPPGSTRRRERWVRPDHDVEGGEVGPARLAFASKHLAKIVGLAQPFETGSEALADSRQGCSIWVCGDVACGTKNELAAVLDLPRDELASQPGSLPRV